MGFAIKYTVLHSVGLIKEGMGRVQVGFAPDTESDRWGEDKEEGKDSKSELTSFKEQGLTDENTELDAFGACSFRTHSYLLNVEQRTEHVTISVLFINEPNMYE